MVAMRAVLFLALLAAPAAATSAEAMAKANPIRKVVSLLQKMEIQVKKEGEIEEKLFEKFMCYCKTNKGVLEKSIADAQEKLVTLKADLEAAEAEKAKTEEVLEQAKKDRADAKSAMEAATAQREKEAASYAQFQADSVANINAVVKAVAALEKGAAGGFLQTGAASTLKKLVGDVKVDMSDYDRQQVMSFLSGNPFSQGYAAQSDEITGILKQMGDEMAAALAEATHIEEKAIHNYNELMEAKTEEVAALTKQIEQKIRKAGELAVAIAEMKNDSGDTAQSLEQDQKFLAELDKGCATKEKEWDEVCKLRQQELAALADTIKILNDDDSLELFKKTLPAAGASFMEVAVTSASMRARARAILQKAAHQVGEKSAMMLVLAALNGKKIGFEKVIAMIDEMVATLKQEQKDDETKKEYCDAELDSADDKKKALEKQNSDTEANIAATKEGIATVTQEIADLMAGIKKLDEAVATATEQRKEENAEYKQLMADDSAAKEILKMAMNRLNKFYNPKLYVPPPKKELGAMGATYRDVTLAEVKQHGQVAPPPPPETFGPYTKKTEEHSGVVQMINILITDLDKEMAEAETTEKDSQADYEVLMKESATKRATDSKSLADKEAAKAEMEGDLERLKEALKEGKQDLAATMKLIADLHLECDWLLKYFDVRQEMRASEVDALGKAKAVLSGADYSLLETQHLTHRQ